jgi:hypothetical protein
MGQQIYTVCSELRSKKGKHEISRQLGFWEHRATKGEGQQS